MSKWRVLPQIDRNGFETGGYFLSAGKGLSADDAAKACNILNSGGWISLKERLPEQKELVLLCKLHYGSSTLRRTGTLFNEKEWFVDGLGYQTLSFFDFWQPLPSPPKGE